MARPFAYLGNPTRFMKVSRLLTAPLFVLGVLTTAIGLYWGIFIAPEDYQQGSSVWIMYIHVPSAWLAMMTLSLIHI